MGSDLEGYGARYVRYSKRNKEHGLGKGVIYIGEWSWETRKPHGRGIRIFDDGHVRIGYRNNGKFALGKYIDVWPAGKIAVGKWYQGRH